MITRPLEHRSQLALAEHALRRHRRWCRTCRRAPRSRQGLCGRGRRLLYALEAASDLVAGP